MNENIFIFDDLGIDTICWIPKHYSKADNTYKCTGIADALKEEAKQFSDAVKCDIDEVSTYFVVKSSRYKNMRVYYVDAEKCQNKNFQRINMAMYNFLSL